MGRENCSMTDHLGGEIYCGYYDVFFMKCNDCLECPEGLDDEDDDYYNDDDYYEDDEDF